MIKVSGVSKLFHIPHQRRQTVFDHLFTTARFSYEPFHALRDVSFEVGRGEFVGVMGPNGCGKSTLLRIVAGIYPPSTGTVEVEGRVAPVLELGVGFQETLSVRDNVFLYGALLGFRRRQLASELPTILARAGLERFEDAALRTLSSGMKARLAFTLALGADADVLVADEALAVGDADFRVRCLEEIADWRRRGRTALFVSHDESLVRRLCDRLIVLESGVVQGQGPPDAMLDLYHSRHAAG